MAKLFGAILLVIAVLMIRWIWLRPSGFDLAVQRPSETPVPAVNVGTEIKKAEPLSKTKIQPSSKIIKTPSAPQTAEISLAGKVKFSSASLYSYSYPQQYSRIGLQSRLDGVETANITGWKIKSNRGEFIVPRAAGVYEPYGSVAEKDIVLQSGHYVEIYSLVSPLGKNLRLNKCVGYLEEYHKFQPVYLPKNCPSFSRSEIRNLSGQCQDYIWSLGSCRTPEISFYNFLPGTDEGNSCRAFLQNINYGGCFRQHRGDADFFSNTWLIWNNAQILDPRHDYLRLYDAKGNLIDEYSY